METIPEWFRTPIADALQRIRLMGVPYCPPTKLSEPATEEFIRTCWKSRSWRFDDREKLEEVCESMILQARRWPVPSVFQELWNQKPDQMPMTETGNYTMRQFKQAHPAAKTASGKPLMVDFVETRRDHRGFLVPILDEDESQ